MSRRLKSGITAPKGFLAAGVHSGIKKGGTIRLSSCHFRNPWAYRWGIH